MTRTTFPLVSTTGKFYSYTSYGTPATTSESTTFYTNTRVQGYRDSVSTPGFHKPGLKGQLKPNPFEFRLTKNWLLIGDELEYHAHWLDGTAKPGNTDWYFHKSSGLQANAQLTNQYADTTAPSDLDGLVRNLLLDKMKDMKGNLGELFAERDKTATMVGEAAMGMAKAMGSLRHGNFVEAASHLGVPVGRRAASRFSKGFARDSERAIASGWLQLKYGWEPLMSDIYGSLEVMASKYENPAYITTTVKRKRTTPWSVNNSKVTDANGVTTQLTYLGEKRTSIKYGVTYYRSASPANTLNRLGITNPALLAWELIPYSFVVDWFLPIGNYLNTFDATLDLQFYSGYRTLFSRSIVDLKKDYTGFNSSNLHHYDNHFREACQDVFCKRIVLTDFPSPAIPGFKNPVSLVHMANGLALLSQLFRK